MAAIWKMPSHMESVISTYKTLTKIPNVLSAKLDKTGRTINSKWSIRNLDRGSNTHYNMEFKLDENFNVINKSTFGVNISNQLLSADSPSENFKAVIYEDKTGKESKTFLEVWSKDTLAHSVDLTALDIHGNVYGDSEFGCLDWSADEKFLVYVAEKKPKKSEPFIKRKPAKEGEDDGGSADKKIVPGEEHLYKKDWGEQLTGKIQSVIVLCEVEAERFTVLQGLPDTWCPGQVCFAPDGVHVVGVAWDVEKYRLGLIYCTNRLSYIFSLNTKTGAYKKLSGEGLSVRSPRVSPVGDLVWLQRAADGPHHAAHKLMRLPANVINQLETAEDIPAKAQTVVDIVETSMEVSGSVFHGLYCQSLPRRCFSEDGARLALSTPQRHEVRSYVVNLASGSMVDISNNKAEPGSTSVVCVRAGVVLAVCSNLTTPSQLCVANLPAHGSEEAISWRYVWGPQLGGAECVKSATVRYLDHEHEDSTDDVKSFTSLYMAPPGAGHPLIVWPHGGPHSAFANTYFLEAAFYNMLGFACVLINYRGSVGAGERSVHYLPGKVGDADVKDCEKARLDVIHQFPVDREKVLLSGGSHGGFLVTSLSGQYPGHYRAVVTRNPVIDVASMINTSDIPDWYKKIYFKHSLGFALLRINYRGSTGAGDAHVRCLLGHAGEYDVIDCLLALKDARERVGDTENVVLYGGSFGGFTVAHLAGRYPGLAKAVVMRNPLIDMVSKENYADNPDGCAVEAGFEYTERGAVSEEQLLALRRCSPLVHAHAVTAPTCLLLGSSDKRVPAFQGLEYGKRLKANGVKTRIHMYEDNHTLGSLPVEMDSLINAADWLITAVRDQPQS